MVRLAECPNGLESEAIPEYAYFGPMIASMDVTKYTECLDKCIKHSKCTAVNFFAPMTFQASFTNEYSFQIACLSLHLRNHLYFYNSYIYERVIFLHNSISS